MKNYMRFVLVISVCILMLIGCGKNKNSIPYGDVVYDFLEITDYNLEIKGNTDTFILREYTNASDILEAIGLSATARSPYDESFFDTNDLVVVILQTDPNVKHTLESLEVNGDTLTVGIREKIPNDTTLLGAFKAITTEVQKGYLPEDIKVDVQLEK